MELHRRADLRSTLLPSARSLGRWLAVVLTVVVGLPGLGCAAGPPPPSAPSPILGKSLPEFKRRAVDGSTVDTQALRGKVVVVKFFAKYCEPCKKTLPATERLHQDNADVAFIGIAEDEYAADVDHMIQTYRLTFPVVHDRGNVLSGRFRVSEMPISFVADASGTIRWIGTESHSEADLKRAIVAASGS